MAAGTSEPRYSRRILGLGAIAAFVLFVVGAPIFVNRVEDDLERRVPERLAALGFVGLTVEFSGQDGTIGCAVTLTDPEAALAAAYEVDGVRVVELERSCRVNTTTESVQSETTVVANPTTDPTVVTPETTVVPEASTTTVPPDFDTLADIIHSDPHFSLLSVLIMEAGIDGVLGDPTADDATMFAPTDTAFDALGADAIAELRSDTDLLERVLNHHLVSGRLALADLTAGELTTFDGGSIEIEIDPGGDVTVDGAPISNADINSGNGVLHELDEVLIPADIDLSEPDLEATATALLDNGVVTLEGVVASVAEQAELVESAESVLGPDRVDDQILVDRGIGVDSVVSGLLAELISVMSSQFVSGESQFDGEGFLLEGVARTEEGRDIALAVAEEVGASTDIDVLDPPVSPAQVDLNPTELETALNDLVTDTPILFEPSSAVLAASAPEILDQLAALIQASSNIEVTVEGHTDSDGSPNENRVLSLIRANAVREELVDRGIEPAIITFLGFGSDVPVLVDGKEDKTASRRVEFRVVAAS